MAPAWITKNKICSHKLSSYEEIFIKLDKLAIFVKHSIQLIRFLKRGTL